MNDRLHSKDRELDPATLKAVLVIASGLVVLGLLSHLKARVRRSWGARSVPGERVLRRGKAMPARFWVSRGREGGPRTKRTMRDKATLVLTDARLVVATRYGIIVELPGSDIDGIRCTGPGRLVIEGHPPGTYNPSRVELLTPDATTWVDAYHSMRGEE